MTTTDLCQTCNQPMGALRGIHGDTSRPCCKTCDAGPEEETILCPTCGEPADMLQFFGRGQKFPFCEACFRADTGRGELDPLEVLQASVRRAIGELRIDAAKARAEGYYREAIALERAAGKLEMVVAI